jgi:hypothetical protein
LIKNGKKVNKKSTVKYFMREINNFPGGGVIYIKIYGPLDEKGQK